MKIEVGNYELYPGKYYNHIDLTWKISGPVHTDLESEGGNLIEKSCYNYNQDSVAYVGIDHPGFRQKITNFIYLANKKKK